MAENQKIELEFPQNYPFKVVVNPNVISENSLLQVVLSLIGRSDCIKKVATKSSKTKKYLSYTIVVSLENREELETIYRAYKEMEGVIYLL